MSTAAEVTILLPMRDLDGPFLRESIGSVLAQTSGDWSLLLICQDGVDRSTDQALAHLGKAADSRVRYIQNPTASVTGALNLGMRQCATAYVCVLHDDDMLEPWSVAALGAAIQAHPETDYFHSSNRYIDEEGQYLTEPSTPRQDFAALDFVDRGMVKPLHAWRVDKARQIGGMDESLGLHGGDDYDFSWRMAESGARFQAISECLYLIRDHRQAPRLTTHVPLDAQLAELRKIFVKHGVAPDEIEAQLERRRQGYLRQALFQDESDRAAQLAAGKDLTRGWRAIPAKTSEASTRIP